MVFNFLFWFFLAGILVAGVQDLRRREVDNWLNLFLLISGWAFLVFNAVFNWNISIIVLGIVSFLAMFLLANLFYYGRVFAGGDAKLLFAMFALFVAGSFEGTMISIGFFVLFLMIAGSVYGILWSLVLFVRNFKEVKKDFGKQLENIYFRYLVFAGIILFALNYVNWIFLLPAVFLIFGPFLYIFAKSLEKVVMVRMVRVEDLVEGDWLVDDVKVGKKIVKAGWEGLSKSDLKLLRGVRRKIKVKEGLPFVPAFLLALLAWQFRDYFLSLVLG